MKEFTTQDLLAVGKDYRPRPTVIRIEKILRGKPDHEVDTVPFMATIEAVDPETGEKFNPCRAYPWELAAWVNKYLVDGFDYTTVLWHYERGPKRPKFDKNGNPVLDSKGNQVLLPGVLTWELVD